MQLRLFRRNKWKNWGKNHQPQQTWQKLGTKIYIAVLVNKTDFDDKLKNLNRNVTSNKIKQHVLLENELNELSEKFRAI